MGTTGSSAKVGMNSALPDLLARVREYATVPLAVGFGVATREHFETVAAAGADGVVIGSRLVTVMKDAPKDQVAQKVNAYCREISLKGQPRTPSQSQTHLNGPVHGKVTTPIVNASAKEQPVGNTASEPTVLPARFGQFGGQYVPEALVDCLVELEAAHKAAMADPAFWKEFESYYGYMNRPSQFYFAEKLTAHAGGAKIWLKREDLFVVIIDSTYLASNDTAQKSHWVSQNQQCNRPGEVLRLLPFYVLTLCCKILLAKRLGKKRIIAETGAGQHGVATATVCARFGLECVIYMGSEDVRRQALNVFRIQMLGGKVITVVLYAGHF